MKKVYYYDTPIGKLGLAEEHGFLTNVYFMNMKQPLNAKQIETDTLKECYIQLVEYFNGTRKEFDLPLNPIGTDFQQTVWSELLNIPYGETRTYKEIAAAVGDEKAVRAIGSANNRNPIPILIPCHRVVGSDFKLTGYAGGLEMKKQLLELEGLKIVSGNIVS